MLPQTLQREAAKLCARNGTRFKKKPYVCNMNELIRHIETLLRENDCVIVPGFGGFIASYSPAQWVESEEVFLPPVRRIGFNAQLTLNDGLIVQSYMQAKHIDFATASGQIKEAAGQLKQTLHEKGEARLGRLGRLKMDIGDTCLFEPDENGIASPALYGLDAFHIEKLLPAVPQPAAGHPDENAGQKLPKRIPISYRWLQNAAVAAVAVIAFFLLSVPVENTYIEAGSYAALSPVPHIGQQPAATAAPLPAASQETQQPTQPKAVRVEKVPAHAPIQAATAKATTANGKQYHIIIASASSRQTAEKIAEECVQQGYTRPAIIEGDGRMRVCLMSFPKKHEAYGALQRIKEKTPFKDAWVLRK